MNPIRTDRLIKKHIRKYFKGYPIQEYQCNHPRFQRDFPRFRVMEIEPLSKRHYWTYISVGAWEMTHEGMLEFMYTSPKKAPKLVLELASDMVYHRDYQLGLGHTFPIGGPWLDHSKCDHILVSKPYPYGPNLEICPLGKQHLHILWLLPITQAERDYKIEHGLEALELAFEQGRLDFTDINRQSIV